MKYFWRCVDGKVYETIWYQAAATLLQDAKYFLVILKQSTKWSYHNLLNQDLLFKTFVV